MSNEELAVLAKSGDKTAREELWNTVKPLLYAKAVKEFKRRRLSFVRCGVQLDDLRQSCYLAFVQALDGYKADRPECFVTYLSYPFQNAVNDLLSVRNGGEVLRPLNNCASLDTPVSGEYGEPQDETLVDFVKDCSLVPHDEQITKSCMKRTVRRAVGGLPEPERTVVRLYDLHGESYEQVGLRLGITRFAATQIRRKAIRKLRCRSELRKVYDVWSYAPEYSEPPGFRQSEEYAAALARIERSPGLSYGQRQAVLYDALMRFRARGGAKSTEL
ncbi:MAG: sigma-70 family RNA polymerase sigma factor [Ruminiclostridium sp.]|nr:sigma-70 family RNA polymerase sigma factor [Ruminiclostridium sp.]